MPFADPTPFFQKVLFQASGQETRINEFRNVAGGCINNAVKIDSSIGTFFLKWNEEVELDMFEAEAKGLELLAESQCVRVPEVIRVGQVEECPYLLLEYLESAARQKDYWVKIGHQLAQLHEQSQSSFGLDHSNYIGRLPQRNTFEETWVDFFIQHRLEVQLGLAIDNGYVDSSFARRFRLIYAILPNEFPEERPSLLHGDLWSGNVMIGPKGEPVILDPAVFYGHREAELAFTHMFGGFNSLFYSAYDEATPLEADFEGRIDLYNLYPLLVHVNLFGTSYLPGVERTLKRFT